MDRAPILRSQNIAPSSMPSVLVRLLHDGASEARMIIYFLSPEPQNEDRHLKTVLESDMVYRTANCRFLTIEAIQTRAKCLTRICGEYCGVHRACFKFHTDSIHQS